MNELDTPDLCARLDTMKRLCDQLQDAQGNEREYGALVEQIRAEANALRDTVCSVPVKRPADRRNLRV